LRCKGTLNFQSCKFFNDFRAVFFSFILKKPKIERVYHLKKSDGNNQAKSFNEKGWPLRPASVPLILT